MVRGLFCDWRNLAGRLFVIRSLKLWMTIEFEKIYTRLFKKFSKRKRKRNFFFGEITFIAQYNLP